MDKIKTGRYVISLIASVLNDTAAEDLPEGVSTEDVFRMSLKHNTGVMCLTALKKAGITIEPELLKTWEQRNDSGRAQSIVQLHERDEIYAAFERNHIAFLPLKGCLLKEMYPDITYRQMADLDILVKEEDKNRAADVLNEMGYKGKPGSHWVHDSFKKGRYMNVEIHYRLLLEDMFKDRHWNMPENNFFLKPWDYIEQKDGIYHCRISNELFYSYMIIHAAKHYYGHGTGIRQFMDIAVMNRSMKLDHEEIYRILGEYGLEEFCRNAEALVSCWMNHEIPDGDLADMEAEIIDSGSYGNTERTQRKYLEKNNSKRNIFTLIAFILHRLFPPYDHMRRIYPVLKKVPFLYPLFWPVRIITRGFRRYSRHMNEVKTMRKLTRK